MYYVISVMIMCILSVSMNFGFTLYLKSGKSCKNDCASNINNAVVHVFNKFRGDGRRAAGVVPAVFFNSKTVFILLRFSEIQYNNLNLMDNRLHAKNVYH